MLRRDAIPLTSTKQGLSRGLLPSTLLMSAPFCQRCGCRSTCSGARARLLFACRVARCDVLTHRLPPRQQCGGGCGGGPSCAAAPDARPHARHRCARGRPRARTAVPRMGLTLARCARAPAWAQTKITKRSSCCLSPPRARPSSRGAPPPRRGVPATSPSAWPRRWQARCTGACVPTRRARAQQGQLRWCSYCKRSPPRAAWCVRCARACTPTPRRAWGRLAMALLRARSAAANVTSRVLAARRRAQLYWLSAAALLRAERSATALLADLRTHGTGAPRRLQRPRPQ